MRTIRCDAPNCRSTVQLAAADEGRPLADLLRACGWSCVRLVDDEKERHLCQHHARPKREWSQGANW